MSDKKKKKKKKEKEEHVWILIYGTLFWTQSRWLSCPQRTKQTLLCTAILLPVIIFTLTRKQIQCITSMFL